MPGPPTFDEALCQQMPLPLAQVYARAFNSKSNLGRSQTALYLWEALIKLLGCVAIAEYTHAGINDAQANEMLRNLARPSLGHWWSFCRTLIPLLASHGVERFIPWQTFLSARMRDALPQCSQLDNALVADQQPERSARAEGQVRELFDKIVMYRNRQAHAAQWSQDDEHFQRVADHMLAAAAELLHHVDPLAGNRLLFLDGSRREGATWQWEGLELRGQVRQRIVLNLSAADALLAQRLYILSPDEVPRTLFPLMLFEEDEISSEVFFLNARAGRRRTEYLCYSTGRVVTQPDENFDPREVLARLLNLDATHAPVDEWVNLTQAQGVYAPKPSASAPQRLGDFDLISELGRGGMAIVYRAWQPSLERQVALKCLQADAGPIARSMFNQEIQVLARVEHPNFVKLYSSGQEQEQLYFAMELLEGVTLDVMSRYTQAQAQHQQAPQLAHWFAELSTACEQRRKVEPPVADPAALPAKALAYRNETNHSAEQRSQHDYYRYVARLMRQAASALKALHEQGLIHRDIKPNNLLLSPDGEHLTVTDLGLALDSREAQSITNHSFVGTPRYASPEQLSGCGPLTPRTDLFSLGATFWELLAQRPLVQPDQTNADLVQQRLNQALPKLQTIRPQVPRSLAAIIARCMCHHPAERYASASDLVADLTHFIEGNDVVAAHSQEFPDVVRRWAKRNPQTLALYALAMYSLAVTLLLLVAVSNRSNSALFWRSPLWFVTTLALAVVVIFQWLRQRTAVPEFPMPAPLVSEPPQADAQRTVPPWEAASSLTVPPLEEPRAAEAPREVAPLPQMSMLDMHSLPMPEPVTPAAAAAKVTAPETVDARAEAAESSTDVAFSSRIITERYPAPIALAYQRFCRKSSPDAKLKALTTTAEVVLRYLAALAVSDLLQCKSAEADPELPVQGETFQFLQRSKGLAMGTWRDVVREAAEMLASQRRAFCPELAVTCRRGTELMDLIAKIISVRNDESHTRGGVVSSERRVEQKLREARPLLDSLLWRVRFVCDYPLGMLTKIEGTAKHAYSYYRCMGAKEPTAGKRADLLAPFALCEDWAVVVHKKRKQMLYLCPMLSQHTAEESVRRTLFTFERILDNRSGLASIDYCSIDVGEPWTRELFPAPVVDKANKTPLGAKELFTLIRGLPAVTDIPARSELAECLLRESDDRLEQVVLDDYRLEKHLGSGGFGDVYSALHKDGREVAIKVMRDQGVEKNWVLRFKQESLKLRTLDHPCIIKCFDFGEKKIEWTYHFWYAMEYAAGGDLNRRIRDRKTEQPACHSWPHPPHRGAIIEEFRAIATAATYLHEQGIVHRDIKPANVLVMEGGELRLSDFGLMKNLGPSSGESEQVSNSSGAMGTRPYMAPEQEEGKSIDETADVFALGIVLAELATGQRPLTVPQGENRSALFKWQPIQALPTPLQKLIFACTQVDCVDRPQNAQAVLEAFNALEEVTACA